MTLIWCMNVNKGIALALCRAHRSTQLTVKRDTSSQLWCVKPKRSHHAEGRVGRHAHAAALWHQEKHRVHHKIHEAAKHVLYTGFTPTLTGHNIRTESRPSYRGFTHMYVITPLYCLLAQIIQKKYAMIVHKCWTREHFCFRLPYFSTISFLGRGPSSQGTNPCRPRNKPNRWWTSAGNQTPCSALTDQDIRPPSHKFAYLCLYGRLTGFAFFVC